MTALYYRGAEAATICYGKHAFVNFGIITVKNRVGLLQFADFVKH